MELDDRAIAKAEINLGQKDDAQGRRTSRPAMRLAEVLGGIGLELPRDNRRKGSLFITTAARLADDTGKKGLA